MRDIAAYLLKRLLLLLIDRYETNGKDTRAQSVMCFCCSRPINTLTLRKEINKPANSVSSISAESPQPIPVSHSNEKFKGIKENMQEHNSKTSTAGFYTHTHTQLTWLTYGPC